MTQESSSKPGPSKQQQDLSKLLDQSQLPHLSKNQEAASLLVQSQGWAELMEDLAALRENIYHRVMKSGSVPMELFHEYRGADAQLEFLMKLKERVEKWRQNPES